MKFRRLALVFVLGSAVICGDPANARAQSYGTELPFVLGTGARSHAMGTAGVSHIYDASVQSYNPAGLGYLQLKQFLFYRTTLFDSESVYHAVSYAHPLLNYGTLGVSVMRLDIGGIEERNNTNELLSSDLHNAQTRILLGYAKNITSSLTAGVNLKLDNQSFGEHNGSGFGLDVGLMANQALSGNSFIKGFREGFAIQNLIEPSLKLDSDKVSDPFNVAFGVSAISGAGDFLLVTSLDLVNPRYSPFNVRIGQEVMYDRFFALRAGLDDATVTFGFGALFRQFAIDYAYRDEDLGNNHRFSLTIKFGASLADRRMEARQRLENEVNTKLTTRMAEMEQLQIQAALSEGDRFFADGDYEKAAEQFEMALLWNPDNEHALEYRTRSKYNRAASLAEESIGNGDYVQGLFHANQALSILPYDPSAADMARRCNDEIAAAQNSRSLMSQLLKTSIDYYAGRHFAAALSGFEEALRIEPTNALASEYRDKCLFSINEQVNKLKTEADAAAARGDFDGAILATEAALQFKPNDPIILGTIDSFKNRKAEAAVAALQATPVADAPVGIGTSKMAVDEKLLDEQYRKGMRAFDEGNFDDAIGAFTKVWAIDPDYHNVSSLLTKAYLFVGMQFYSDHRYTEAIDIWQKALIVNPENSKAKRYLSKAHEELQKLSGVYRVK